VKFKLPGGEVSGVYRNHETWHIEADAHGYVTVKDPEIEETLLALANDPTHPIELVKATKESQHAADPSE
jgi:hypothetical protein